MFAKKAPVATAPLPQMKRKELEYLYARRSAIDALIQSLEEYDRFRTLRADTARRKMA